MLLHDACGADRSFDEQHQNHAVNRGFPLHPSPKKSTVMNYSG